MPETNTMQGLTGSHSAATSPHEKCPNSISDLERQISEIISKHWLGLEESSEGGIFLFSDLHEDFLPVLESSVNQAESVLSQTDCPTKLQAASTMYNQKATEVLMEMKTILENENNPLISKDFINMMVLMGAYIKFYLNKSDFPELNTEEYVFKNWEKYEADLPKSDLTTLIPEKNQIIQQILWMITPLTEKSVNHTITELWLLFNQLELLAISLYRTEITLNNRVVDERATIG